MISDLIKDDAGVKTTVHTCFNFVMVISCTSFNVGDIIIMTLLQAFLYNWFFFGNPLVTEGFPSQSPVTQSFNAFFNISLIYWTFDIP